MNANTELDRLDSDDKKTCKQVIQSLFADYDRSVSLLEHDIAKVEREDSLLYELTKQYNIGCDRTKPQTISQRTHRSYLLRRRQRVRIQKQSCVENSIKAPAKSQDLLLRRMLKAWRTYSLNQVKLRAFIVLQNERKLRQTCVQWSQYGSFHARFRAKCTGKLKRFSLHRFYVRNAALCESFLPSDGKYGMAKAYFERLVKRKIWNQWLCIIVSYRFKCQDLEMMGSGP